MGDEMDTLAKLRAKARDGGSPARLTALRVPESLWQRIVKLTKETGASKTDVMLTLMEDALKAMKR
jgi:predicted DNA-binding protein